MKLQQFWKRNQAGLFNSSLKKHTKNRTVTNQAHETGVRMRSALQNILVITIIIITFLGSGLLFWNFNTKMLFTAVEVETNLSSTLLSHDLNERIPRYRMISDAADDLLTQELQEIEEKIGNESNVWILDESGNCYYENGTRYSAHFRGKGRENVSEGSVSEDSTAEGSTDAESAAAGGYAPGSVSKGSGTGLQDAALQEALKASVLEEAAEKGIAVCWVGRKAGILLHQKCCIVRPIYNGSLFLVVINMADSAQALQRQQFTLFMVIDVLLVLVMIILTANSSAKYRRELIRFATTDELTGLANRKSFNSEFAEFIQSGSGTDFSIFLLDIDYFKQINDNYGHAAGDHALQYLAQKIREMVKKHGGLAGRWGGDEFIGLLPVPPEKAHAALSALCGTIESSRMDDGFRMTISAGVAPAGGETQLVRLSEKADLALYRSKEKGRNQATVYRPDMKGAEAVPVTGRAGQTAEEKAGLPEQAEANKESGKSVKEEVSGLEAALSETGHKLAAEKVRLGKRIKGYVQGKLIDSTMLGVRWMAPFVAGGGILIALAFLFDAAAVDLSALSVADRANFGSITEQAAALKNLGGITFNFMLPVFAGFMAYGIAGEEAFMTGFVGGNMTISSNAGFIGAMIAGFAAGIITNEVRQFMKRFPLWIRKAGPIIIYPVFNLILMQLLSVLIITPLSSSVGATFVTLLDHLSGTGNAAVGAFAGAMMAVDMGGIINKVAYNYGVNGLLSGRTDIMAAVMIGGMVPPIGIALSTVFFRNKFTEDEKERGVSALFMGLSFITEGALPYVFTDFIRVIPCCMIGSGTAGFLSMLLGCTLPAPHGGLFVLPVMGHPMRYLAAILVGSLITAITLGFWKKAAKNPQTHGL